MSAPFSPAARTRTSSSCEPGSRSGRSSSRSSPSAITTARTSETLSLENCRSPTDTWSSLFPPPRGNGVARMAAIPFPRLAAPPPLWREALVGLEAAALLRRAVFRGEGVADGRGQPVLLVPGFLAGDGSLGLMTQWLRRTGHHTRRAGI